MDSEPPIHLRLATRDGILVLNEVIGRDLAVGREANHLHCPAARPHMPALKPAQIAHGQARAGGHLFQGHICAAEVVGQSHGPHFVPDTNCVSSNFVRGAVEFAPPPCNPQFMTKAGQSSDKAQPHYIRQWRKRAGLSLEQLAEASGYSTSHLSRVERHQDSYSQEFLESLARALNCRVADLFWNPDHASWRDFSSIIDTMTPEQRNQALAILDAFTRPAKRTA